MKKKIFFLSLLFNCFFVIPFSGTLFAAEIPSSAFSRLSEFTDLFLAVRAKEEINYILYARPENDLGDQLRVFWNDVKDEGLDNPAVLDYPPHITLTGFFPIKKSQTENDLKVALKAALKKVDIIPIVIKGGSVVLTDDLDYIPFLYSSVLHSVAKDFLTKAKISQTYIRPKPKSTLGYHLSLRQNTDPETTLQVRTLEEKDIHLEVPDLQANTTWALYIYKKVGANGVLKLVYKQNIETN